MKQADVITTKIHRETYKKIQMLKLVEGYSSISAVIEMLWDKHQESKSNDTTNR
jgi:predicted CopG family antitoxin